MSKGAKILDLDAFRARQGLAGVENQVQRFTDMGLVSQDALGRLEVSAQEIAYAPDFDGSTYDRAQDHKRLSGQLRRVFRFMADGQWRTLAELSAALEFPEASVSARLRDLRKPKFGGYVVSRRRVARARGLWEYRLEFGP